LICIGAGLSLVAIGIKYFEVPDAISFALWLLAGLGMVALMHNAHLLWYVLPEKFRRVRTVEESA
jgi:hypothetical protein